MRSSAGIGACAHNSHRNSVKTAWRVIDPCGLLEIILAKIVSKSRIRASGRSLDGCGSKSPSKIVLSDWWSSVLARSLTQRNLLS